MNSTHRILNEILEAFVHKSSELDRLKGLKNESFIGNVNHIELTILVINADTFITAVHNSDSSKFKIVFWKGFWQYYNTDIVLAEGYGLAEHILEEVNIDFSTLSYDAYQIIKRAYIVSSRLYRENTAQALKRNYVWIQC